jgi:hypothetical protein
MLSNKVDQAVTDIENEIERVKARYDSDIAALKRKRAALVQARKLVTKDVEDALLALELAGISVMK